MLNFRVASGDKVLEEHLKTSSRNAKYTSAPIQNEVIDACGKVITQKLAMRIKESGFFPVIADEATDISNKQQLVLVIRYLDLSNDIREDFMKSIHCEDGVTGENIKNYILEAIREVGIDMSISRGQGYDGGGNMAWSNKCSRLPYIFIVRATD